MKIQKIKVKNNYVLRERRPKTIELKHPLSIMIMNIVRQLDMAESKLRYSMGEPGQGITIEEAMVLLNNATEIVQDFSKSASQFCEKVGFDYYPPKGLETKKPKGLRLVQKNADSDYGPTGKEFANFFK